MKKIIWNRCKCYGSYTSYEFKICLECGHKFEEVEDGNDD